MSSRGRSYTDAQKAAYYKRKAAVMRRQPYSDLVIRRGRGAYTNPMKQAVYNAARQNPNAYKSPKSAAFGRKLASTVADMTPLAPISGLIGKAGAWLGDKVGTLFGLGAYDVRRNSLLDMGQSPPAMHNRSGDTIIRHREFITDLVSHATPNTFKIQSHYINPGLVGTFPWLADIASAFEEYELLGCVFDYKTTSSDALNSTNTALGSVIMATNYNAASAPFANKISMENTQYSNSCKPSLSMLHPIECDPYFNPMMSQYIRSGATPSGQDQKTYDLGQFQIASTGFQGSSVVFGELWVSYEVALRKPIYGPQTGSLVASDHYYCTGCQGATVMGSAQTLRAGSSIGGTATSTAYTWPVSYSAGNFLVSAYWQGTSASINAPGVTLSNCSLITLYQNASSAQVSSPQNGVAATQLSTMYVVSINAPGSSQAKITWSNGGTIPTTSTLDLMITQINDQIITSPFSNEPTCQIELLEDSDDDHVKTMRRLKKRIGELEQLEKFHAM
nr:putative capsid protein [Crucivirus sp.]